MCTYISERVCPTKTCIGKYKNSKGESLKLFLCDVTCSFCEAYLLRGCRGGALMQKLITILMIFRRLKNVNNKTRFAGNVNTWSGLTNSSDREKVVHFFCPVFLNARMNPR